MRIAIFTDSYYPHISGVSKTVDRYINYMEKMNHEFILFLPSYSRRDKSTEKFRKMRAVKFLIYPDLRFSFVNYRAVKRALDNFKPDVIQVMTEFPIGRSGVWYGKKHGVPVVTCFETNIPQYMDYYKLGIFTNTAWLFYKWFHHNSDFIITPSSVTTNLLKNQGFKKVWTWERGIESDHFNPDYKSQELRDSMGISKDDIMFLYVGRIAAEKDLHIFIDAAKELRKKYGERVHFVITGGGPNLEVLKETSPDFIRFTGFLTGEELLKMYASADVFLFPSPTETLGFVILEAMASGLPVVACFEGGIRDTLVDGYNGIACREKNTQDYVNGAIRLIEDPQLRKEMSNNAIDYAKSKDWDCSFEKLFNLYDKVIYRKNKLKARRAAYRIRARISR